MTPEVNDRVSVRFIAAGFHVAAAAVPSVLSCNCFPSGCEAREPTSRSLSFLSESVNHLMMGSTPSFVLMSEER